MKSFEKLRDVFSKIPSLKDIGDSLHIKSLFYNNKIIINDVIHELKEDSVLVLTGNEVHSGYKIVRVNSANEYYTIELSSGALIHYDINGKAYQSLKPESILYKRRLPLYDIKNIL